MMSTDESSAAIPCIRCCYDLRGLAEDGKCPECGASVAGTLHFFSQWRVHPVHAAALHRGMTLVLCSVVVFIIAVTIGAFAEVILFGSVHAGASRPLSRIWVFAFGWLVTALGCALSVLGWSGYTLHLRRSTSGNRAPAYAKGARLAAILHACVAVIAYGVIGATMFSSWWWPKVWVIALLAAASATAALVFVGAKYSERLAAAIGAKGPERLAFCLVVIGAAGMVSCAMGWVGMLALQYAGYSITDLLISAGVLIGGTCALLFPIFGLAFYSGLSAALRGAGARSGRGA